MKVIKKNYKFVLGILIGGLLGGIGVYAGTLIKSNEVEFTPKNNKWNVTKVDEALNSLYSVAVPEEYSGTTSVIPTYNDVTLNTQDKLLKNNITINGIPSTYKNLTNTTTATAADIATGKTSYNNAGELITGIATLGGDCFYGTIIFESKCFSSAGCTIFEGFNPNKFYIKFYNPSAKINYVYYYNYTKSTTDLYIWESTPKYRTATNKKFLIGNNKLTYYDPSSSVLLNQELEYIVCK